jgi:hypothetical protein
MPGAEFPDAHCHRRVGCGALGTLNTFCCHLFDPFELGFDEINLECSVRIWK